MAGAITSDGGRQGGALPAAVRRLRPAAHLARRHARHAWSGRRPRRPRSCATPRACCVAGAALRVPLLAVILRRGYGLGAQAMTAGSLHEPLLTVAWPSAHLGPMGLEGAVRLALRKELEAIADEDERERRVRELTAAAAGERQGAQRGDAVRARRRDRPGGDARGDRRDVGGSGRRGRARGGAGRPAVRGQLVGEPPYAAAARPGADSTDRAPSTNSCCQRSKSNSEKRR